MLKQKTMKKIIIKYILIFCAVPGMLNTYTVLAQEDEPATNIISAKVVDESGRPVPDVFVRSFVTNKKIITDADGNFTLTVSGGETDQVIIDAAGYEFNVSEISGGILNRDSIVLRRTWLTDGKNEVLMPYSSTLNERSVTASTMISGEELTSYPGVSFLEALSGRLPGLTVYTYETRPGDEEAGVAIRGESASVYIDGIMRDPADLTVNEVESVQVIRDLSGRATLGISGANPVLWITTKKGQSFKREVTVTAEMGMSTPTVLPKYLDSYQYALLFNEALENDGLDPLYSQEALDAYRDGSDPLLYPNIDYYGDYLKPSSPFQRAAISFAGGDKRVNYFSMLDYVGNRGLENMGEQIRSDRYKIRGNVNIRLTEFMQMNVNLSGTYGRTRFPNSDGYYSTFDMFNEVLSMYPSNAHGMKYQDSLLISDDHPLNLENELASSGYGEGADLNTQNTATLLIDMDDFVKGLSFSATASFDVYNNLTHTKGGTEELYRVLADRSLERIVEKEVDPSLELTYSDFIKRTVGFGVLHYDREFGPHELSMMLSYYMGYQEQRSFGGIYQPLKMQDLSYRANYALNGKYILQLDLSYSGSMKLPEGERFSVFPTVGAAWILSRESFLSGSEHIDYLKLYSSLGMAGIDEFYLSGYNTYYLGQTLWENVGTWSTGIPGRTATDFNVYSIQQAGSDDYELPRRSYFNVGIQGDLFKRALSIELNYFRQKDYNLISQKASQTPAIFGGSQTYPGTNYTYGTGFLPATNYGENMKWGLDGLIQHTNKFGDFRYSIGANAQYARGKYLVVDEPINQEEYRKQAGKETDLYWLYESEGLYQTAQEITDRGISQSWGDVQPGDIRYADYNNDGVVDEKDLHTTGAHSPRLHYGLNLSIGYRGFGLFILGQGRANGEALLSNSRYFWINGTTQNYSELMLDRWPESNDYPRLTTISENNYQPSTFWLASAAYFRLRNVELSYTLPERVSQRILMRNCKFFIRASNVLMLSELNKYSIDPEYAWYGIYGYPIFRTMTFGLACKF
jgi:TonB-linked SusC/RagA family outer membrane protein